ncbi:tetratricopeptide repeat protein [candidate division KSB1 bacterium]|jgi:tetratricopeptide (TPR) repeat protein|nr:tetratricopeptide repeat protein [candidate division KSB1 bacterium]
MENMDTSHVDLAQLPSLIETLEKKIKASPAAQTMMTLGNAYYLSGAIEKAIAVFERVVTMNPKLAYSYYYLGICHYRAARLKKAIGNLQKVIELSPDFVMAYYWMGIIHWHLGQFQKARSCFEELLKRNSESPIAHFHAAQACMDDHAYECAVNHLEALSQITKDDSKVFFLLGQCYYRLNKTDLAIKAYKRALKLSPENQEIRKALNYLTEVQEP